MRIQILTKDEYAALLSFLPTTAPRDELMIRLMLQCGLRCGEIKNLNTDDLWRGDYLNNAIRIREGSTKSHKGRYVDIPTPVQECAEKYKQESKNQCLTYNAIGPLFVSHATQKRLSTRHIQRITGTITQLSIGRAIHPHLLRHTYATMLLRHTNIRVVQELLGHSSLSTTQIYTHPTSQECKQAVNTAFDQ